MTIGTRVHLSGIRIKKKYQGQYGTIIGVLGTLPPGTYKVKLDDGTELVILGDELEECKDAKLEDRQAQENG